MPMKNYIKYSFHLLPVLVIILGITVTFIITFFAYKDLKLIKKQAFENTCQEYENRILSQLKANEQVLYNSAAFIASSDSISRSEWKTFQTLNKSLTELPGILGIGFVLKIHPESLASFEQRIRNEGFPGFRVKPEGDREIYTSVLFIEPFSGRNLNAFGFDGYTEPVRNKAMKMACENDFVTISDKVTLKQETDSLVQPGTIMFAPVYKQEMPKGNINERSAALKGWVFCPFRMNDLISGIIGDLEDPYLDLKIFENNLQNQEQLLFSSSNVAPTKETPYLITHNIPMVFNQKTWILKFTKYQSEPYYFSSRILTVFLTCFTISLLTFLLAVNWVKTHQKSNKISVLNNELEKTNHSKDRFISVLAHDLRSPLNSLLGFTGLLKEKADQLKTEELKSYASFIDDSAHNIFRLLDDLLLWAKIDSGKFPFNPEKTDVSEICRNIVGDFKLIAARKNISLSPDIPVEPLYINSDIMMLKTVLRNLIDNAIKFSFEGGRIEIVAGKTGNNITISVKDFGTGMAPEVKAKLFDISSITTVIGTSGEKGTGMGLILCADLIKKNNGEILVDSIEGSGTVIKLIFPEF
jgi:signal transduction histidine kinase